MSHHHLLPPIIHVPQPKPKKIESRKNLRRAQVRPDGSVKDLGHAAEIDENTGLSPAANEPSLNNFEAVTGAEQRPPSRMALLSKETVRELLRAQEQSAQT
jgi:hypothetical protein